MPASPGSPSVVGRPVVEDPYGDDSQDDQFEETTTSSPIRDVGAGPRGDGAAEERVLDDDARHGRGDVRVLEAAARDVADGGDARVPRPEAGVDADPRLVARLLQDTAAGVPPPSPAAAY